MFKDKKRWFKWIATVLVLGAAAIFVWQRYGVKRDEGLASGNGRIEATEIDVAAKIPGRIREILVHEGDFVTAGQVVVLMDTDSLMAQRREAEPQLQRAQHTAVTARSQLVQRQSEKEAAQATVAQPQAELGVAKKRWARSSRLVLEGAITQIEADDGSGSVCCRAESGASQA
jgi:HlyD family secretion protein